ncbi:XdhC family protein [Candidatus Neomarinimicrobiota bacterium]
MEKYIYQGLIDFDFKQKAVLCSQLDHQGSVPRKDFPVMLVLENGRSIGTVGGGMLEHDAIELAQEVMDHDRMIWRTFELTNEDPHQEGSICGGTSRLLIEPYTPSLQQFWRSIDLLNLEVSDGVLITIVSGDEPVQSERHWIDSDEALAALPSDLRKHVGAVRASDHSEVQDSGGKYHLFQLLPPIPVLHIFGAGHVGRAVAEIGHFTELDVVVYDDRPDLANAQNFPYTRQIIVDDFSVLPTRANISSRDYVLVMTRGHQHDLQLLQWLLPRQVRYLGLMSSKRKWRLLAKTLLDEGLSQEAVDSVHAPVGLSIESETVPEIAVSIIAEIIHVHRSKTMGD